MFELQTDINYKMRNLNNISCIRSENVRGEGFYKNHYE